MTNKQHELLKSLYNVEKQYEKGEDISTKAVELFGHQFRTARALVKLGYIVIEDLSGDNTQIYALLTHNPAVCLGIDKTTHYPYLIDTCNVCNRVVINP